ncbi:GM12673 [Drosophila sechellia]|uniref:GD24599 n=2 Tax=melanogaster subgroup TaxID=32351 RepID=B4NU10_DROSI|nr:GM12673 [Drosophila sechellia]EDX16457.1 GD24599 [Drosophila simulans]
MNSIRAGYNQTEQEAICAQWQYQPSEKYVPSQPRTSS